MQWIIWKARCDFLHRGLPLNLASLILLISRLVEDVQSQPTKMIQGDNCLIIIPEENSNRENLFIFSDAAFRAADSKTIFFFL